MRVCAVIAGVAPPPARPCCLTHVVPPSPSTQTPPAPPAPPLPLRPAPALQQSLLMLARDCRSGTAIDPACLPPDPSAAASDGGDGGGSTAAAAA